MTTATVTLSVDEAAARASSEAAAEERRRLELLLQLRLRELTSRLPRPLKALVYEAEVVEITETVKECRDPKDD